MTRVAAHPLPDVCFQGMTFRAGDRPLRRPSDSQHSSKDEPRYRACLGRLMAPFPTFVTAYSHAGETQAHTLRTQVAMRFGGSSCAYDLRAVHEAVGQLALSRYFPRNAGYVLYTSSDVAINSARLPRLNRIRPFRRGRLLAKLSRLTSTSLCETVLLPQPQFNRPSVCPSLWRAISPCRIARTLILIPWWTLRLAAHVAKRSVRAHLDFPFVIGQGSRDSLKFVRPRSRGLCTAASAVARPAISLVIMALNSRSKVASYGRVCPAQTALTTLGHETTESLHPTRRTGL